ncbi:DUF1613-domain-containing protein [Phellopilus nigrolimitatus]|nr:DUF1613-domain-containing protein [Phellopilus nigrolimitatus]
MSGSIRPPFSPSPCLENDTYESLKAVAQDTEWIPFEAAISQLVHHPEYNSTLILRSEVVKETPKGGLGELQNVPQLRGFHPVKNIHRKLLPRRPGRDPAIEQDCTFYSVSHRHSSDPSEDFEIEGNGPASCLVLTPKLKPDEQMPYYHPAVHHLAFRYLSAPLYKSRNSDTLESSHQATRVSIEVVPQSDASDPRDVNSRLYRTCLALLETVQRYGWGISTNYQKRVHHDCLVSREEYQDLYLIMRERHKHLVYQWHEATDPLKHVFEDIGIATFLMLLWKQGTFAGPSPAHTPSRRSEEGEVPWRSWPRPPGGFLDFGCGNGLLVHILVAEGYTGTGIDVRARTSWTHYPQETQAHLHVHALDPLDIKLDPTHGNLHAHPFLCPGTFIIANHADELSPWTPVLAMLCDAAGYLSIPCCAWSFDARFERVQLHESAAAAFAFALPSDMDYDEFVASLRLGGDGSGKSAYSMFRIWLASLSLHCGWEIECETLRIPSTRNWAVVGRSYHTVNGSDRAFATGNARSIIQQVRERGLFKTRKPEGKAGDHQ